MQCVNWSRVFAKKCRWYIYICWGVANSTLIEWSQLQWTKNRVTGNTLTICRNQYTESTTQLRMHAYYDVDLSHAKNCSCGVCGSSFEFLPPSVVECDCQSETLRDAMDEKCTISWFTWFLISWVRVRGRWGLRRKWGTICSFSGWQDEQSILVKFLILVCCFLIVVLTVQEYWIVHKYLLKPTQVVYGLCRFLYVCPQNGLVFLCSGSSQINRKSFQTQIAITNANPADPSGLCWVGRQSTILFTLSM